jgi:hypothetical protein
VSKVKLKLKGSDTQTTTLIHSTKNSLMRLADHQTIAMSIPRAAVPVDNQQIVDQLRDIQTSILQLTNTVNDLRDSVDNVRDYVKSVSDELRVYANSVTDSSNNLRDIAGLRTQHDTTLIDTVNMTIIVVLRNQLVILNEIILLRRGSPTSIIHSKLPADTVNFFPAARAPNVGHLTHLTGMCITGLFYLSEPIYIPDDVCQEYEQALGLSWEGGPILARRQAIIDFLWTTV